MTAEPLISMMHVFKSYETPSGSFEALRDIDLEVRKGEFVAVVGRSGSGKSTLINVLTGIDSPSSGEIHVASEKNARRLKRTHAGNPEIENGPRIEAHSRGTREIHRHRLPCGGRCCGSDDLAPQV